MPRLILTSLLFLAGMHLAHAQQFLKFERDQFGKTILQQNQSTGGDFDLELAVGSYNNEPISEYSQKSVFSQIGRAVGRLDILTDAGVFPCTAFIISEKYILTNHHCVPGIIDNSNAGASRIEAVSFTAGYVREGDPSGTQAYNVSPAPVEASKNLDYAILEVFGNPSAKWGSVKLSSALPEANDPFWIIGHPMGEAQRISREKCKAFKPVLVDNRLQHTCDTLPGNSGSPVIDSTLLAAVGLHHAGSRRNSINRAIPMAEIAKVSNVISQILSGDAPVKTAPDPAPKVAALPKPQPRQQAPVQQDSPAQLAVPSNSAIEAFIQKAKDANEQIGVTRFASLQMQVPSCAECAPILVYCVEPASTPKDLAGRIIRAASLESREFVKNVGGDMQLIAFSEVPIALELGLIDCSLSGGGVPR